MFKFSLEGADGLLNVLSKRLIELKNWFHIKIDNAYYYFFAQCPRRKEIKNKANNLEGPERCVMQWILDWPAKTVGASINEKGNCNLLHCFESLESKKLIILDHTKNVNGTWINISVSFEFLESNPETVQKIIRKALDKGNSSLNGSTDCQQVLDRLQRLASG